MTDTATAYAALPASNASNGPNGAGSSPTSADLLDFLKRKKKDAELLNQLNGWYNQCKNDRQQFDKIWYTNIAFYFGRQYVQWIAGTANNYGKLWEPPAPSWRVRLVCNKIKPIIRGELAKLTKEKPEAFVIPSTSQEEDVVAAEAAESIFEHQIRELQFNRVLRRGIFWMLLCGTSYIKDWYDTKKPDTSGLMGTVQIEAISPFQVYVPNLMEQEIENQQYLIHACLKDADWVAAKFGEDPGKLPPDSKEGASTGSTVESQFRAALGVTQTPKNQVLVKEGYIKPSTKWPMGLIVFWTETGLLSVTESLYFKHNEYPFSKLDHIPTGRFYSDSVIPDLVPLQKELNRSRSQIVESKNLMSKPQLIAPKGSIDVRKMTSAPGLVIEYTPGFNPPQPLQMQNLPPYVSEELERIKEDMEDIAAQHEISKGSTPPNVEAATAISFLQEEDDSRLSPTVASIEECVEKTGRHVLSHVVQFWDAQRQIRVLGSDGAFEAFILKGADISGNIDLRVQSGSAAPRSKAGKQAFIMELGKLGWLPPERLMRYLDMAETGKLFEELNIDSRHAQRESYRLSLGQPILTNTWDNHEIHVMEHNNFRKRQRYELLPDEVKQVFEQHVMQHQQILMQQQGGMMGQQDVRPPDMQPGQQGQQNQPGQPGQQPPPQ